MKSTATVNPAMQGVAVKFMRNPNGFVGVRLFPKFPTGEQSAQYYVFDKENTLNIPKNIQRAPATGYARGKMKLSDDSFVCKEYGFEEPVDDREKKKYASAFDAHSAATIRAASIIRVNREIRIKEKATSAAVPSAAPAAKWNEYNDSNPIFDVDGAKKAIRDNCGQRANIMVISYDVFLILKEHPKIIEKIKYSERAVITEEVLAQVFGVAELAVADAVINGAKEGQPVSPADIWSDSVVLAHKDPTPNLQAVNFGRSFEWTEETGPDGIIIESYRQDEIRSDVFRARQDLDEKIVGAECGFHIPDVL